MRSASQTLADRYKLFGVSVLSCERDDACDLIESHIARGNPARVAFLNANLLLQVAEQTGLREALDDFLVFNDGVGVEVANRVLNGAAFRANLNGTDFVPYFLTRARRPLRLFLVVGRPGTLEKVVEEFRRRWPYHAIVGQAYGLVNAEPERSILQSIIDARPDIVLVALGNPKQELWIARNVPHYAPCAFGIGALFDFLIGEVRRAPIWVRAIRLEWLFRLVVDPRRLWRRYLIGNIKFMAYVLRSWAAQRAQVLEERIGMLRTVAGTSPVALFSPPRVGGAGPDEPLIVDPAPTTPPVLEHSPPLAPLSRTRVAHRGEPSKPSSQHPV